MAITIETQRSKFFSELQESKQQEYFSLTKQDFQRNRRAGQISAY